MKILEQMYKKVSVVIPVFNTEKYLEEAVNSVLCQTYPNIEIILVNDGSTDNSPDIINRLVKENKEIYGIHSENRGGGVARNKGLQKATGEFIQFLDADDIIEPDKIKSQVEAISDDIDWVVSDYQTFNKTLDHLISETKLAEIASNPLETAVCKIITTCNPLYKTAVVREIGGYNENIRSAQDWDFHIRLILKNEKLKYVPKTFFTIRQVENSVSSDWVKVNIQCCWILLQLKDQIIKHHLCSSRIKEHISQIYYFGAVKDQENSATWIREAIFWGEEFSYLTPKKKAIKKLLGWKGLLKAEKLLTK